MTADKNGLQEFWVIITLIFIASAVVTIAWCRSMSAMEDMPMPGGWGMSMMWMLMPGQSLISAGLLFIAMWDVMMIAMMMPCLVPSLLRYRQAIQRTNARHLNRLTALTGLGYFFVWTIIGLIIFPLGIGLNTIIMRYNELSSIVPVAAGILIVIVGALQFTNWKLQRLSCCRVLPFGEQTAPADARTAWKHGLQIGIRCCRCSAGLMSVLLVMGMMDLFAMTIVTAAITLERLAPVNKWVTGTIGTVGIGAGVFLITQALQN